MLHTTTDVVVNADGQLTLTHTTRYSGALMPGSPNTYTASRAESRGVALAVLQGQGEEGVALAIEFLKSRGVAGSKLDDR